MGKKLAINTLKYKLINFLATAIRKPIEKTNQYSQVC